MKKNVIICVLGSFLTCQKALTRIDFFDNIKIGLIICVFDAASSPRNRTQLTGWKCSTDTTKLIETNDLTKHSNEIDNSHLNIL